MTQEEWRKQVLSEISRTPETVRQLYFMGGLALGLFLGAVTARFEDWLLDLLASWL